MADVHHIKLVNRNAKTSCPVYAKTEDSWWTFNIYAIKPNWKVHIPTKSIYQH